MWFLALSVALADDCDLRSLGQTVDRFDEAFVELQLADFQEAINQANRTLTCMTEPLTPVHCAALHRMRAFDAFVSDDLRDATLHFQAVQATQPGYELPEDLVPKGHPMQEVFAEAKEYAATGTLDLSEPSKGWLTVDGQRTIIAPTSRPWVFQQFAEDGSVAQTRYMEVGAPLPEYKSRGHGGGAKTIVLVSGIGLAVAGAGLYGAAYASRLNYDKAVATGDKEAIEAGHGLTNGLALTSFGVGGVGLAMVGVSFAL